MKRQKDLYGYIQKPTLVLHEPDNNLWRDIVLLLNSHCTKVELLNYAEALNDWLGQYEVMRASSSGKSVRATEVEEMTKSNMQKTDIAKGLALVLADQQNMLSYLETLSESMLQLLRTVLLNIYVSQTTAKQILQDKSDLVVKKSTSYYYQTSLEWSRPELKWFSMARSLSAKTGPYNYRDYETYISINSLIHSIFLPYLCPDAFEQAEPISQLPDGHWRIVEYETDSFDHFQLFLSLMAQGELPVRKKGIGVTDMKRAQKKMALTELYPGDTNEYRKNVRAYSYLQMLALHEHFIARGKKRSYQDTLCSLFSSFDTVRYYLPFILFPHIKGFNRQFIECGQESKLCQMLFTWMREVPEGWICLHDVIVRIYAISNSENNTSHIPMVYNPQREDYSTLLSNEYSSRTISAGSYVMEFGYGGLQMCALLMASLGMVEVAFDEDNPCRLQPYENVAYIRLTPLGRYALGITKQYDAPTQQRMAYFELDPDRLIIRSLQDPNPYAQLLKDTSQPISRNRFETSAQSFLANCHSRSDVESKISIFRQFISNELPPLWEQFFQQLLQHCHPLREDHISYRRYTIDPKNSDLIQLITTDPVLRQIVIRAEGYRIMVKTDDLRKFENQLKKHGYLL